VAAISADVAGAIDAAIFGSEPWDRMAVLLSDAFPGSFSAMWNMNFAENSLNFSTIQNIDPAFARSFNEHFAYVNPWMSYWSSIRSGKVVASEESCPARTFARTEFYNDWLMPQKDVEAAAGMKLVGDRGEMIQLVLRFPLSLSETYGRAAVEVITRFRGNLERAVDLARLLRHGAEISVAGAAIVERSRCAAFVVDGNRVLREANPAAERLFSAGACVRVRNGRCFLSERDADSRFGRALGKLSAGQPTDAGHIVIRTAAGAWQVTVTALPLPPGREGALSLLPPRRLVLVLIADLNVEERQNAGDLSALSAAFGLTLAEIAFCGRLVLGESVAEAAERLCITTETARTRLKTILRKTATARQSQLMLLLPRLR
jgi:DNA-binding CsgD family transcriptional regulator